jgi:hypothetical protein
MRFSRERREMSSVDLTEQNCAEIGEQNIRDTALCLCLRVLSKRIEESCWCNDIRDTLNFGLYVDD